MTPYMPPKAVPLAIVEPQSMDVDYGDYAEPQSFDPEPQKENQSQVSVSSTSKSHQSTGVEVKVHKLKVSKNSQPSKATAKFLPKFEKAKQEEKAPIITADEASNCKNWTAVKDTIVLQPNEPAVVEASQSVSSIDSSHDILEEDGSLNLFWFDCFEKKGIVYLFGKVYRRSTKSYISCCALIKNIERNLFVLPRPFLLDDSGTATDMPVTMNDVYTEFEAIRKKYRISQFASRPVTRKYAFELANIPAESQYLKVVYPFSEPEISDKVTGKTFSHVFGTNTKALELFIMKRRLMGPCWVKIQNPLLSATSVVSWCKLELTVDNPKNVKTFADSDPTAPKETPPMVVMSLSLRTVMNHRKQINEIVAASALVYNNVNVDGTNDKLTGSRFTVLRQLNDIPIPVEFGDLIKKQQTKPQILPNERALLNFLIANIHRYDPDILIGHNIIDFDLDVLLHRMKENKVQHWSRIGRLKRTEWPKLQSGAGGTGDSSYSEKQIAAGRLLCDTYRAAQDLVRSKSYSLTSLSMTHLKIDRPNIDFEKIPSYFWDSHQLLEMIQHCEFDTFLTCQLMLKLQILPLTKQLTNLAGNIWSRSMTGARAERNEYLLMHEFHEKKYVCPDKTFGPQNNVVTQAANENDDEGAAQTTNTAKKGRRKAAYAGGLVLEPKKGFYDKYVLLLDFNSLYPSIIQEYNICFTTVARSYDAEGDHMPEPPDPTISKGVLPKLLGVLVERRRLVKGLMKSPKITPDEYAQYDIRQKALKLTANSMYGCLGFAFSRFFAKPLAMLITAKGREILQNTVDLAEKMNLDVIYGDTDSIMIYTNTTDLTEVKKMGQELKKAVNKRYNLLEIEIDGFFQRMLLLKKKKYAAITVEEKPGGELKCSLETKGLDLVRRDWCGLSVDVSSYVLNQIFSGANREDVVERIHQHLTKVGEDCRQNLTPLEKYIIIKSLTKNPEDYADKGNQPHVQVALQMKTKGLSAKVGDTIPYVICKIDSTHIAQKARHPDELKKAGSELQVDIEWYLTNQVHPPISRLCQPIDGTDPAQLASCLGLDAAKFNHVSRDSAGLGGNFENDLYTLESQLTDAERFKDVELWNPRCVYCGVQNTFAGPVRSQGDVLVSGMVCPNQACGKVMPLASLAVQLRVAVCNHMRRYMDQGVVCDDAVCRCKTRSLSVYGRRCLATGCKGSVSLQFGDRALYVQMQYFENMFNVAKLLDISDDKDHPFKDKVDEMKNLLNETSEELGELSKIVEKYLSKNARRWVDLDYLFSFSLKL